MRTAGRKTSSQTSAYYRLGGGRAKRDIMVGHLKVAYQNVCKSSTNANTFLQWCWERKVDIVFIGKRWWSGEIKSSTTAMDLHLDAVPWLATKRDPR